MPEQGQQPNQSAVNTPPPSYEQLVQQVAQRVWEIWQQELRREQERRGQVGKR